MTEDYPVMSLYLKKAQVLKVQKQMQHVEEEVSPSPKDYFVEVKQQREQLMEIIGLLKENAILERAVLQKINSQLGLNI